MKFHGGKLSDNTVRIAVLGAAAVGKSALVVRYLTRRFIWDYDPTLESVYERNTQICGQSVCLKILDTAAATANDTESRDVLSTLLDGQLMWADAVLLVYSLTDRSSFEHAMSLCSRLDIVSTHCPAGTSFRQRHSAVAVVGNKSDLYVGRCVDTREASERVPAHFRCVETSAMEGGPEIASAFDALCHLVIERRTCASPPGELADNYSRRRSDSEECKRRFLRQQLTIVQAVAKLKRKLNRSFES